MSSIYWLISTNCQFHLSLKNKNSRLLAGVIYRSEKLLPFNDWLEKFEDTIGYIKTTWDGLIMITGDMNIDLLSPDTNCRNYQGFLKQFNLTQHR